MKIIYNKEREKNIRATDRGGVLKIIKSMTTKIAQMKKGTAPNTLEVLREVAQRIRENKPK